MSSNQDIASANRFISKYRESFIFGSSASEVVWRIYRVLKEQEKKQFQAKMAPCGPISDRQLLAAGLNSHDIIIGRSENSWVAQRDNDYGRRVYNYGPVRGQNIEKQAI